MVQRVSGPFNDGINVVALMLARNEDWVIGASLRAALQWCDQVCLALDRCSDRTAAIADEVSREFGGERVMCQIPASNRPEWEEMQMRQDNFLLARQMGGTHFAIIDADEIPSANVLPHLRVWLKHLAPGQLLDLPMIPVWEGLDQVRDDECDWTRGRLTIGFRDQAALTFATPPGAYQHHDRPPKNCLPFNQRMWPIDRGQGGVFHLQFANKRRLLAKHVLYRMVDHLRWPAREGVDQLNKKYDNALSAAGRLAPILAEWWGEYRRDAIDLTGIPWQEAEIRRLLNAHGSRAFEGLDLKGFSA